MKVRLKSVMLRKEIENWLLAGLQQQSVRIGGRLVKHARRYCPMPTKCDLTRLLFGAMLWRIWAPPVSAG